MLFLEGLKLIWRKFLTSKWTRQCEFCFAWKSRMSTWLSFCFIRIKPLGRSFRLCSKYTSILKINGIFSVKVHSYEYIYHCMFLCGIRVCFLLIWHPNHQVEYIIRMYCWPNKWYNLKNPVLLLRIRLFSTECKTWKAKYIHSYKTYPSAIFKKIGKDERSKAFVIAGDNLDRIDLGNFRSWTMWRGRKRNEEYRDNKFRRGFIQNFLEVVGRNCSYWNLAVSTSLRRWARNIRQLSMWKAFFE